MTAERKENFPSGPLPKVVFHKSLESPDIPYSVDFNAERFAAFLQELKVPENRIRNLKITIKRSPIRGLPFRYGRYNPLADSITIYTDAIWKEYQEQLRLAKEIAYKKKDVEKDQFKNFLHTKRLAVYLTQVPPERGIQFAEKLLDKARGEDMNHSLLHEAKHFIDARNPKLLVPSTIMKFGSPAVGYAFATAISNAARELSIQTSLIEAVNVFLGWTLPLLAFGLEYEIDPMEQSARRFAKQLRGNFRWRPILTINPKK